MKNAMHSTWSYNNTCTYVSSFIMAEYAQLVIILSIILLCVIMIMNIQLIHTRVPYKA